MPEKYAYVAWWEGGLSFGYSNDEMDIITQIALVGLAGQDLLKAGVINNIASFKEAIDEANFIRKKTKNGYIIDLIKTYESIAKWITTIEPKELYSAYITEDECKYEFNNIPTSNL